MRRIAILIALLTGLAPVKAQEAEDPGSSIELIDPRVFRVCSDPRNLPFSNQKGEGFENKLAEVFAKKLGKSLTYVWYPGATGFVRNTLRAHRCDVIMGFPQGDDLAQNTNPYYRSVYSLVFKSGHGLDGIESLSDPRLKDKRIGIVAGTPPATNLAVAGLLGHIKSYPLVVDTRVDSSAEAMIKDIVTDEVDVGILWGPMAGYYSRLADPHLVVVPLVKETSGPHLAYRITLAVRPADQEFKRLLNRLIQENQGEINKVLLDYGVPILDEKDQLIAPASFVTKE